MTVCLLIVEFLGNSHLLTCQCVRIIANNDTVKPVISGHSKRRPKLGFKTDFRLMQVKSIAEYSKGSILQYF